LAFAGKRGSKWSWVIDGRQGAEYDRVVRGVFSPDSRHFAYYAYCRDDNKCFLVVEGTEGFRYHDIADVQPFFSPNSQHVAYIASYKWPIRRDGRQPDRTGYDFFLVINENEGEFCNDFGQIVFAPGANTGCYSWKGPNSGWLLADFSVYDLHPRVNQWRWRWNRVDNLVFTPDGKRILFVAKDLEGKKRVVIADGTVDIPEIKGRFAFRELDGEVFDDILPIGDRYLRFSSSNTVSYVGYSSNGRVVLRIADTFSGVSAKEAEDKEQEWRRCRLQVSAEGDCHSKEPSGVNSAKVCKEQSTQLAPGENNYRRAVKLAHDGYWQQAIEELKQAVNSGHSEASEATRTMWCPRCGSKVPPPGIASFVDYARFWTGRCPRCESVLHFQAK